MSENTQQPPVTPGTQTTTNTSPSQTSVETTQSTKLSPKESIKLRINQVKHSLGIDDPNKVKRTMLIVVVIVLLVVVLVVAYSFIPKQIANPLPTLTPFPSASSEPINDPSPYVNDPELLRILDSVNKLDGEIKSTILREDDLRLPAVDWNVTFNE